MQSSIYSRFHECNFMFYEINFMFCECNAAPVTMGFILLVSLFLKTASVAVLDFELVYPTPVVVTVIHATLTR